MIKLYSNLCDFCGTCVSICPENCIELQEFTLIVDHQSCTRCRQCIWVCPSEALYLEEDKND